LSFSYLADAEKSIVRARDNDQTRFIFVLYKLPEINKIARLNEIFYVYFINQENIKTRRKLLKL